jgi:hypothetical protein
VPELNDLDFDSMTREELIELVEALDGLNDKGLLCFVVQGLSYAALSDKAVKFLAHFQVGRERKKALAAPSDI